MSVVETSGWRRLLTLEPALVRGAIGTVVALAGIWGIELAELGERVDKSVVLIFAIVPLLVSWWTRNKVTPYAYVAAKEDPSTGVVVAGPAAPQENGTPVTVV